jgi:hypothetical protein
MELLPEDVVLSLLYYLSPPSVGGLFLTCSSFSYLGDKEKVLPLLSYYLPHRDVTALTLTQIFNVYYSSHRTKRIVIGDWVIVFIKGGRAFATPNVRSAPTPVDMKCDDVIEVVSWGDAFWILGKGYLTCTMELVTRNESYFYRFSFDAIQVVGMGECVLILASDGRVLTTTFSWNTLYSPMTILDGLPPVSYMVACEEDTVKLVDVDNKVWLVESVVPLKVREVQLLVDGGNKGKEYEGIDMEGVEEVYDDPDGERSWLIMEDGSIDVVEFDEVLPQQRERYPHFSF